MKTIEDQLELERTMVQRGADNYERNLKQAEEHGRASETSYARRLIKEFMQPLIDELREFIDNPKPGRRARVRPLLSQCEPEKAVYLAMQALFNSFTFECALASLAVRIGRMIEDEVRFTRFEEMHGDYYRTILEDFKRKGTRDYRYKQRVLTHKAQEYADQWEAWTPTARAEIGMKLIDLILTNTDLIEKRSYRQHGKTKVQVVPTEEATAWINQHNEFSKFLWPEKMPCVIPPDEWTGLDQGGYYTPELRQSTPMIKTTGKRHRDALADADLSSTMQALNRVQSTAWSVNTEILSIVKEVWRRNLRIGMPQKDPLVVPPSPFKDRNKDTLNDDEEQKLTDWKHEAAEIYTREKERVGKSFQVSRIIRLANEFAVHGEFWYVWYADFRGRFYTATAGFSPQGPDLAKGILRFSKGKPLGDGGWYWLRVHGANRFGYDKVSYDERVAWIDEHQKELLACANDPLSHRDLWANADKPWQFLAFLFEYRDCIALQSLGLDASEFVSHLPIGLDGSCNGLQNFSAALRDSTGGRATNLVPSDAPSDIYRQVADVCTRKLHELLDDPDKAGDAQLWLDFCAKHGDGKVPRSLAKRPVMTLPYGATRQSCTKYIFDGILDHDREHFRGNFKAACWLTPIMWASIGEVVVAARDAMDWLQKCSSAVSKTNSPLIWDTPDGFRIFQGSRVLNIVQIETQLAGRFRLNVGNFTDKIDSRKQRNSVAPNFVHSMDAAHLRDTVRRAFDEGISAISVIHDDYGTYAADTGKLHRIIREAFVSLYEDNTPLADFKSAHESADIHLPPLPKTGDLDINEVLNSRYFFG
nr:DNA-directed RNA polymerase [Kaustia mangrovi]